MSSKKSKAASKTKGNTEARVSVKYIFLDIVSYSHERSVEAQADIIGILNKLVRNSVNEYHIDQDAVVYLPTGDGICVALLGVENPYDILIRISLLLLKKLNDYNKKTSDEMRRFKIRIGLNANVDNIVTDINGKRNVAGAGINLAQRVMNVADANQILAGEAVYETLRYREKYMQAFSSFTARIKHGLEITVHQLIQPAPGLDISVPEQFMIEDEPEPPLTLLVAYYFAHAIKNRQFLTTVAREQSGGAYAAIVLLYMLANDSTETATSSEFDPHKPHTWGYQEGVFIEQFAHYNSLDYWIICDLSEFIFDTHLVRYLKYFEPEVYPNNRLFINRKGREKLQSEHASIWKELKLENTD
jgi:class 3 adenylate cyclase